MLQEVLKETEDWQKAADRMIDDFVEETPFHGESFNFTEESMKIEEDETKVRNAKKYQCFALSTCDKKL